MKSLRILVQMTHNRITATCYVVHTKQNLGDPDDRRISRPAIPWHTAIESKQMRPVKSRQPSGCSSGRSKNVRYAISLDRLSSFDCNTQL